MRLSYKKYPILESLHDGIFPENFILNEDDIRTLSLEKIKMLETVFALESDNFKSQILVLSQPFIDASFTAKEKLTDLYFDIISNSEFTVSGTIITADLVSMVSSAVSMSADGSPQGVVAYFLFHASGCLLAYYIESARFRGQFWISSWVTSRFNVPKRDWLLFVSACEMEKTIQFMFQKFASVEVVEVKAGKKIKTGKEKILNETGFDALYLDSKWFTTLVRSEGFNVRGHFRMQPKKKGGEWTKEIIWIDEFQKHGYTSPARKLRPENTQQ